MYSKITRSLGAQPNNNNNLILNPSEIQNTYSSRGANYPHVERAEEGPKDFKLARSTVPKGGFRTFSAAQCEPMQILKAAIQP